MSENDKRDDDDLDLELDLEDFDDLELDLDEEPDGGDAGVDEAEIAQLLSEDAGEVEGDKKGQVEEDLDDVQLDSDLDVDPELDLDLDLDLATEDPAADAAPEPSEPTESLTASVPAVVETNLPETTGQPAAIGVAAAEVVSSEVDGQWVWQFAAPPPPPPFSAVYFSGTALKELYSFFFCGILVLIGCLLPWAHTDPTDPDAGSVLVPGFSVVGGMISLPLALYLILGAGQGIYSRRQKIFPVVLMLVPAGIAVMRLIEAWGALPDDAALSTMDMIGVWLHSAGTGVVLTAVGSIAVSLRFVMALGKIVGSKDPKKEARKEKAGKGARKPDKKARAKKEKPAGKDKRARGKKTDDTDAQAGSEGKKRGRRGRKR